MKALMRNKKIIVFLVLLLCAGCFHEEASMPSPNLKTSPTQKHNNGFSVVSGEKIGIQDQVQPKHLSPTKAISFVDELHGYGVSAGTRDLQFLKSSDGGMTWRALSKLPHAITPSAISFFDSLTGWLLTSEASKDKLELRLTLDGGLTWEIIAQDLPELETRGEEPFFRFFDRHQGLIAFQNGKEMMLLRTQDGGLTWFASSRISMPIEEKVVFTFRSAIEGWFIGPSKKDEEVSILYHMTDGETWQETGRMPNFTAPQAISFTDSHNGFILLQTIPQSNENEKTWQFLRTLDGGNTWSQHRFPNTFQPPAASLHLSFPTATSGWLLDAKDLWRTTDGGLNWRLLTP
ncbi:WD40/YVTN/BNR-like repeat-containing protein [Paenibacillus sp. TAF58]